MGTQSLIVETHGSIRLRPRPGGPLAKVAGPDHIAAGEYTVPDSTRSATGLVVCVGHIVMNP